MVVGLGSSSVAGRCRRCRAACRRSPALAASPRYSAASRSKASRSAGVVAVATLARATASMPALTSARVCALAPALVTAQVGGAAAGRGRVGKRVGKRRRVGGGRGRGGRCKRAAAMHIARSSLQDDRDAGAPPGQQTTHLPHQTKLLQELILNPVPIAATGGPSRWRQQLHTTACRAGCGALTP